MNFMFYMGHPAHYHNVAVVAGQLAARGHGILFVVRDKDVLLDVVRDAPYAKVVLKAREGNSKLSLVWTVVSREMAVLKAARKWHPDVIIGTDIVITHVSKLLGIPSLVLNEDDADQIPLFAHMGMRFATRILSPACCDNGPYNHKTIRYKGYHELAYLHPKYFKPDASKVRSLSPDGRPYFIVRFSALSSHHDVGRSGISDEIARRMIERLEPRGRVFITSERPLSPELEPYRIRIDPVDMHHALYYAKMYLGDSQTMTAEAAVLGTPSIRFNDFVGKLSYLEELEHEYGLTCGVRTDSPDRLIEKIDELLGMPDLDRLWKERRSRMLADTIDVAEFFSRYFERAACRLRAPARHPQPADDRLQGSLLGSAAE